MPKKQWFSKLIEGKFNYTKNKFKFTKYTCQRKTDYFLLLHDCVKLSSKVKQKVFKRTNKQIIS